jgi:hypothetical protein
MKSPFLLVVVTLGFAAEARAELHAPAAGLLLGQAEVPAERGSPMWDAGGIIATSIIGAGFGLASGAVISDANDGSSGPIIAGALLGAFVGSVGGLLLGEWARSGSLAARIMVVAVNVLASAAMVCAVGGLVVLLSSSSGIGFIPN